MGKLLSFVLASCYNLEDIVRVGVLGTCLLDMNNGGENIVYIG